MSVEEKSPIDISRLQAAFYYRHINFQDLAADVLESETSFDTRWRLLRLMIHFSVACSETLTITFTSKDGTTYDTVISTQVLVAISDIYIQGEETDIFEKGDELKVEITSGGASVAYLTIIGKEIP